MHPATPGGMGNKDPGWRALRTHRHIRWKRKSTFQTFGKDHLVCSVPSTVPRDPICCGCRIGLGSRLPVHRAEAALPYWVPLSLRPRKQIQKMARAYIPRTSKVCPCPCHQFGGRLPTPRDQAVMPYWVPRYLRTQKVEKRQQSVKAFSECPLDSNSWYNRWRICCDTPFLLKWQELQALHHDTPATGREVSLPDPALLPLGLSFLTLLHAVLRVLSVIRQLFWV